jgi:hypothetical protein
MNSRCRGTRRIHTLLCTLAFALFAGGGSAWALGSFSIQINAGPGLSDNPDALAAFERAAQEWESRIFSPITIYIDADLGSTDQNGATFPTNVIGETSFDFYTNNLSDINLPYRTVPIPANRMMRFSPRCRPLRKSRRKCLPALFF